MKFLKLFSIIAMSALTINMSAALTASAVLTVSTLDEENEAEVQLYENPSAPSDFTSLVCAGYQESNMNDYAINMWVETSTNKYSVVDIPSLTNLTMKFKANSYDSKYVMSFSTVAGQITLSSADTSFVIDASKSFTFNCATGTTMTFTINPQPTNVYVRENLTINQWGTICYPKSITAVEGGTLYYLTHATETEVLGDVVTLPTEAGKPYVFKASAETMVMTYTGDSVGVQTATGLVGTYAEMDVPAGMYGINGTSVMEVAAGTKVKANRAYIDVEELRAVQAPQRTGRKIFDIAGEVTGLEAVKAADGKATKVMINGKMVIMKGDKMFNAQGMEL